MGSTIGLACIVALIWKCCILRRESKQKKNGDIFIPTDENRGQKESPTEQHVNCGKEEFVVNL